MIEFWNVECIFECYLSCLYSLAFLLQCCFIASVSLSANARLEVAVEPRNSRWVSRVVAMFPGPRSGTQRPAISNSDYQGENTNTHFRATVGQG